MTYQWIDTMTGLAYIAVSGQMRAFIEFLNTIDQLIASPEWRPGTPVIEDLRDYHGCCPPNCVEEWRRYVAERQRVLRGCRWAIVRREDEPRLLSVLDTAAVDAEAHGVVLRQFSNMLDAHLWAEA
jgi:hypothetical protein